MGRPRLVKPLTYDDWRAAGFQVRRGERSTGRDKAGRPTFSREQVEERPETPDPDPFNGDDADEL